jgi:hypothetical protein
MHKSGEPVELHVYQRVHGGGVVVLVGGVEIRKKSQYRRHDDRRLPLVCSWLREPVA